ncbi:MAG: hypothetical protein IJE66_06350, partial [Akkermansia sp.]|nr:hypothetical protein [Akkermansia sp.]
NSARSARMMNDEGRLALVETICAQRSELFIRTSSFVNRTSLQLPICHANLWDTCATGLKIEEIPVRIDYHP